MLQPREQEIIITKDVVVDEYVIGLQGV